MTALGSGISDATNVSGNTDRCHIELFMQYSSPYALCAELYFRLIRFQRHPIYSEDFMGKQNTSWVPLPQPPISESGLKVNIKVKNLNCIC